MDNKQNEQKNQYVGHIEKQIRCEVCNKTEGIQWFDEKWSKELTYILKYIVTAYWPT